MTDEEMAELYANKYGFGSDFNNITSQEANQAIEQAFLAGLKQTKWHKVADGDLPKQDGHTCFSIKVLSNNKKWVYYEFASGKWFCGNKEVKVESWFEIPMEE